MSEYFPVVGFLFGSAVVTAVLLYLYRVALDNNAAKITALEKRIEELEERAR